MCHVNKRLIINIKIKIINLSGEREGKNEWEEKISIECKV